MSATVNEKMTAIADAIRSKTGKTGKLGLDAMATEIASIETGSGESIPTQQKTVDIVTNGTHVVTPDAGYALSSVTANVNVPIPSGYLKPEGTLDVTENGTHDVAAYQNVRVNVQSGSGSGEDLWQYVTTLSQTFQYVAFPDGYELTLNVPNLSKDRDITQVIGSCTGLRKLTIKCGREDIVLRSYFAFASCYSVEEIDLSQFSNTEVVRVTKPSYLFYSCQKLKTIRGVLDFSQVTESTPLFASCMNLENIEIAPGSLKVSTSFSSTQKLTDASIQSIIDGLADLTGQTAQTLTLHADAGAKLTDAQKAAAAAKNWTIAY